MLETNIVDKDYITQDQESLTDTNIRERQHFTRVTDRLFKMVAVMVMALEPHFQETSFNDDTPHRAVERLAGDDFILSLTKEAFPEHKPEHIRGMKNITIIYLDFLANGLPHILNHFSEFHNYFIQCCCKTASVEFRKKVSGTIKKTLALRKELRVAASHPTPVTEVETGEVAEEISHCFGCGEEHAPIRLQGEEVDEWIQCTE